MAFTLKLKKRQNSGLLYLEHKTVKAMVERGEEQAKKELWDAFKNLANDDTVVHDKVWLENLANWMPEGGLKLTEVAKWMKLIKRINSLDDTREGDFTLSDFQADLLWGRMTDEKYKLAILQSSFIEFISDFQEATGKHFPSEDPTKDE